MIRIKLTSIVVTDQERALAFYTGKLGFVKKRDFPVGGPYRWITVVSPAAPEEVELSLEPVGYPFVNAYQKSLFGAGIPATAFAVDDVDTEYVRLTALGVAFKGPPAAMGPIRAAMLDDTCGNYIQIYQPPAG